MTRLEFLLEEPSMEKALKNILPAILPPEYQYNINYFLRPHHGKSDLQKSIPNKMKHYGNYHEPILFIILHDQDSNDCIQLRKELMGLCENGRCPFLIRIVCRELESWFLGDMDAIETAFPGKFRADKYKNKAKFRNPDLLNAADELGKILPGFNKGIAAEYISKHLKLEQNTSPSFKKFVSGLKKILPNNPEEISPSEARLLLKGMGSGDHLTEKLLKSRTEDIQPESR